MADIAMLAGIAKGTLYNHFRTKEAVYAATVDANVKALIEDCTAVAAEDLAEALALAAERLGNHPALRRIGADEPAVMAALVTVTDDVAWSRARAGVAAVLTSAGRTARPELVDLVLRWLVSFVATPGHGIEAQAAAIAAALPDA